MLLLIEDIEHSHDSANFVAGASSISSKAEVEFVPLACTVSFILRVDNS